MRRVIFWIHLACGVTAGAVILMMSITGVLLTYERQMIAWADTLDFSSPVRAGGERLPLSRLLVSVERHAPDKEAASVMIAAGPREAVSVSLGRGQMVYLDPYSGAILGEGAGGIREFFRLMVQWHRWFNIGGEGRDAARAITGACNVIFLFLILSGVYLWLPKIWKWSALKLRLVFGGGHPTGRARDFNWHHVFGFWSSFPLAVVVATAFAFSYPAASDAVYRVFGEDPPVRGGPPQRAAADANAADRLTPPEILMAARRGTGGRPWQPAGIGAASVAPDLEALFTRAAGLVDGWHAITLRLPVTPGTPAVFTIDRGTGGQPQKQSTLSLDAGTAEVIGHETFYDQTPGRRARSLIRRLHTGEALGVAGQTLAGLVSFAGVMLVWTGLALAYRRLVQPIFNR